jgi:hypothetical protein
MTARVEDDPCRGRPVSCALPRPTSSSASWPGSKSSSPVSARCAGRGWTAVPPAVMTPRPLPPRLPRQSGRAHGADRGKTPASSPTRTVELSQDRVTVRWPAGPGCSRWRSRWTTRWRAVGSHTGCCRCRCSDTTCSIEFDRPCTRGSSRWRAEHCQVVHAVLWRARIRRSTSQLDRQRRIGEPLGQVHDAGRRRHLGRILDRVSVRADAVELTKWTSSNEHWCAISDRVVGRAAAGHP